MKSDFLCDTFFQVNKPFERFMFFFLLRKSFEKVKSPNKTFSVSYLIVE